jgi:UDP-glucose 4-epimerase
MNSYLVTGAAGFIGSAIAKRLLEQGYRVVTIDNLSTGVQENIPDGCIFIQGNVQDESVIKQLENYTFDAIIHIAGQSSGEVSFEAPVYDLQTNAQSTLMLLQYAQKTGCKQFLYASSMSVYGDAENEFVNEQMEANPKSFYAVGKLASEKYMRIYSAFGIQCTALRFFNVYGIGQNLSNMKQGMASIYLTMAIADKHIVVKGAKDRFRDFIYIDDVVDAVIASMNRRVGKLFEIYNVSTSFKTTVEQVLEEITANLPYPVTIEYIEGTPGDQKGVYGDNTKLKSHVNWQPKITFKDGIRMMVDWAREKLEK